MYSPSGRHVTRLRVAVLTAVLGGVLVGGPLTPVSFAVEESPAPEESPEPGVQPTLSCPEAWAAPVIAAEPSTVTVTADHPDAEELVTLSGSGPATISPTEPSPVPLEGTLTYAPTVLDFLFQLLVGNPEIPEIPEVPGLPPGLPGVSAQEVTATDSSGGSTSCTIEITVVLFDDALI